MADQLVIAGRAFGSRLIVGTGKYRSFQEMARAHAASGAAMVTVAVRRVNLTDRTKESLLDYIDRDKLFILPNTAGCYTADEAIRTARLGREVGLSEWVKLEVIGDEQTLFPDTEELIRATKVLVKEGFVVLPYTNDDLIVARKLIDAGAAAVMPLGAPIGSGMGIQNLANLRILRERITEVPLIVDAGVGTASDAAIAMELGADGVLMNTAIAGAQDAVADGRGDARGSRSGAQSVSRRAHREEAVCDRVEPAGWRGQVTPATILLIGGGRRLRRLLLLSRVSAGNAGDARGALAGRVAGGRECRVFRGTQAWPSQSAAQVIAANSLELSA